MNTPEKKYLRMSVNERIQHFFLLSSFMTLIITGFWLKFPEAGWVKWMIDIIGKNAFSARANIHRTASVIMILASVYHVFYITFTVRGRKLVKDLWIKKQDALDMMHSILYLAGSSGTKPKFGRFSYIEKMEYWAVVWGTVIMGLTGGVLWFENTFMSLIRPEGMYIATTIHYYEAILASLAILVWHFYFVFMNPDIKGMNKAWITGYLTGEEMKHEHPLELEELEKTEEEKNKKVKLDEKIAEENKKISMRVSEEEVTSFSKPVIEKPVTEQIPVDGLPVNKIKKEVDLKSSENKNSDSDKENADTTDVTKSPQKP